MKKTLIFILMLLFIYTGVNAWNDEVLFSGGGTFSILKPNIMILMDNSGSMNTVIFPSSYDSGTTYTGPSCDRITSSRRYDYYRSGSNRYLRNNSSYYVQLAATGHTDVYEINQSDCDAGDGFTPNQHVYFYIARYNNQALRVPGNLINFLVYHATAAQLDLWNHFMVYDNWDLTDFNRVDYTKSRIRVAAQVLKDVITDIYDEYDLDPNPDKAYPRIGLAIFETGSDPDGGTKKHDCQTSSSENAYHALINGIAANTWTPLSETYVEIWSYFRHGGEARITDDKYFLPMTDPGVQNISANTPITNWCQLNFIIVMTDGESTRDDQIRDLGANTLFHTVGDTAPWGDVDGTGNDVDTDNLPSNGTNYLDDLAYFAYHNDLWPDDVDAIKNDSRFDSHMINKQFIYTYTIGFSIDNILLRDTAVNGGGEYYTADDYDSLLEAMQLVFASIDEKVRAYAAFTAPKFSLTYGDKRGYVATFVPKNNRNIWEGHLKGFTLTDDGDFPDLENPGAALLWDAGEELVTRVSPRDIYTYLSGSLVDFDTTNVSAADLGFNSGDATVDDGHRDIVVDFIRGNNGYGWPFGEIFHFNPVVVGAPLKWKADRDPSYRLFFDELTEVVSGELVSKRDEVVYVGANDGMIHCFRVEDGKELWALIPPSLLTKLRDTVEDVPSAAGVAKGHQYFVDGRAMVRDIKIADTNSWTDWRTVIIFGMGIGGKTYVALDVTDPESPEFLWEFSDATYMAFTEAKPIIVDFEQDLNGDTFPGVILSGGYDINEEPATTSLSGKSFFVLHAYDGTLIKKFIYAATTSSPDTQPTGTYYLHKNSGFKYALTATPTAYDKNNDGLVDYVYMCESGDYTATAGQGARIWKINLGGDPEDWRPTLVFQTPDGQTIYLPPTLGYDNDYNLWVLFGSGHRPLPNHEDNITGQFYGFVDSGSISSALTISDLRDVTSSFTTPGSDSTFSSTTYQGFYFEYVMGAAECIFEPNPIFLNSTIYFNTYQPISSGEVIDPCIPQGNQYVYNFKISSSVTNSTFKIESSEIFSGKIQGYGSLSGGKYKIYFGTGEVGSPDILSQETIDLTGIFGPIFWIENKF